jgi:hypothetical protein
MPPLFPPPPRPRRFPAPQPCDAAQRDAAAAPGKIFGPFSSSFSLAVTESGERRLLAVGCQRVASVGATVPLPYSHLQQDANPNCIRPI